MRVWAWGPARVGAWGGPEREMIKMWRRLPSCVSFCVVSAIGYVGVVVCDPPPRCVCGVGKGVCAGAGRPIGHLFSSLPLPSDDRI